MTSGQILTQSSRFTQYVLDTNLLRPLTDERDGLYSVVHKYYDKVFDSNIWIPDVVTVESIKGHVNNIKDSDSDSVAVKRYGLFRTYYTFLRKHQVLAFNADAIVQTARLKQVGGGAKATRDRRIAASALARGYVIATRNTDDFIAMGVPAQNLVNWALDPDLISQP